VFAIDLRKEKEAESGFARLLPPLDGGEQMARMDSPAGQMEVTFSRVDAVKNEMVVTSRFGVWDSKIHFSPDELVHLMRLMLNPSVILLLLRFPFVLIGRRLFQRTKT